ncbi:MAG: hypothetical protein IKZ03_01610 [Clostridia bacterium]|nr:hypothetical protein [Clostridia bacterium]
MSDRLRHDEISTTVKSCGYTLCYKLIKHGDASLPSYSFFVSIENEDEGYHDEVLIRDVTSCKQTARRILGLIIDGTVTPMTLRDVLEDLLS